MAFIKSIGKVYFNNIGFDLHENEDGTATIRPVKLGHDLPGWEWKKFESLEAAENWIDKQWTDNLTAVGFVSKLQDIMMVSGTKVLRRNKM